MQKKFAAYLVASAFAALAGSPSHADAQATMASSPQLPTCAGLAAELTREVGVTKATAVAVRTADPALSYCRVEFTFDSGMGGRRDGYREQQRQAIGLRIGLPLRVDDGGSGLWNGRIQNLGSGGCMGNLPSVTPAISRGYVGSSGDGGHGAPYIGFNCDFGVIQEEQRANEGLIRDFSRENVVWQTRWARRLTEAYYGAAPKFTYWSGCSQGGRQGHIALQTLPGEVDGILAGGSALYWMRFQMAQAWSGLVIKDVLGPLGKTLTATEIDTAVKAEIAGCDGIDGVSDGELRDPRLCRWSARQAICGVRGAPAINCLDADQARAFDLIRRGPRNAKGELIWFPWEPGTTFSNNPNYLLSDGVMRWTLADTGFSSKAHVYMDGRALRASGDKLGITYEDLATLASRRLSALTDTDAMPSRRLAGGKTKVISWTGTADRNIQSRNSIKYYRDTAAHFRTRIDDPKFQSWFRLFLYPSVDHCIGGAGHQPGDVNTGPLFDALVDWVEKGQAPERIIASHFTQPVSRNPAEPGVSRPAGGALLSSRPVCAYPKMAVYQRSGPTNDASSFTCAGNLETKAVLAQDRLAPHRMENGSGRVGAPYGP